MALKRHSAHNLELAFLLLESKIVNPKPGPIGIQRDLRACTGHADYHSVGNKTNLLKDQGLRQAGLSQTQVHPKFHYPPLAIVLNGSGFLSQALTHFPEGPAD